MVTLLKSISRLVTQQVIKCPYQQKTLLPAVSQTGPSRLCSSHDNDPDYNTPSPYRKQNMLRGQYKYKYYTGGLLPRPKGKYEDIPLPDKKVKPWTRDHWTEKKALFGQNDYIDILGDGSVQPWQIIQAPRFLKAFKGNEFQRLTRQLRYETSYLEEVQPFKLESMKKRIFFLHKKLNQGRHLTRWWSGGKRNAAMSRFKRVKKW